MIVWAWAQAFSALGALTWLCVRRRFCLFNVLLSFLNATRSSCHCNTSACCELYMPCCAEHHPGDVLLAALAAAAEKLFDSFTPQNLSNLVSSAKRTRCVPSAATVLQILETPQLAKVQQPGLSQSAGSLFRMFLHTALFNLRPGRHVAAQMLAYAKLGYEPPASLMAGVCQSAKYRLKDFTPQVRSTPLQERPGLVDTNPNPTLLSQLARQ